MVGRLGMSVLRDATYATLGARASLCTCRVTTSHFEVAYDGVARLARPHMRTCICVFSSRRACAVSAFFTFGPLGPHTSICARKGPFPRSFSSLPIFFIFFNAPIPKISRAHGARLLYVSSSYVIPHTSHQARTPRASSVAAGPAPSHASTPSSPPLSPLSRASCPFFH